MLFNFRRIFTVIARIQTALPLKVHGHPLSPRVKSGDMPPLDGPNEAFSANSGKSQMLNSRSKCTSPKQLVYGDRDTAISSLNKANLTLPWTTTSVPPFSSASSEDWTFRNSYKPSFRMFSKTRIRLFPM